MPKTNRTHLEDSENLMEKHATSTQTELAVQPMVICGVNRKANIGNFETIDVYCGVSVPVSRDALESDEALREAVNEAARIGFEMASQETFDRYNSIKGG
jgi:hypothetical protein